MIDQMISYATAELASQKGYPLELSDYDWAGYDAGIPSQSFLQRWLRGKGIHIELIVDGWGDDQNVQNPYYRAFIWQVGKPKPGPADDIGGAEYECILESALQSGLNCL